MATANIMEFFKYFKGTGHKTNLYVTKDKYVFLLSGERETFQGKVS